MLTKINGFCALKIRFLENHRGQTSQNEKKDLKNGFLAKIRQPGDHGCRVAGDHGPRSPVTMVHFRPFGHRCSAIFRFFFLIFSLVFFLTFLHIYWPDFPAEKLTRSRVNRRAKFLIFQKSRRLCRVELSICR